MTTKTIHRAPYGARLRQTVFFQNATPQQVYDMLMDSKQHAAFSDSAARISQKVGGTFSAYDGYAEGKNLELQPGKRIVQAWRGSDWPKGVFSTATFTFSKVPQGTKLTFLQTGVPEKYFADVKRGWIDYYWKPMAKLLATPSMP